ncbi:MAG: hypothetical protein DME26_11195, partial [Verrucomicrobia bacterium]
MKKILVVVLGATLAAIPSVFGQPTQPTQPVRTVKQADSATPDRNVVTFDLHFPGGTPIQL